MPTRPKKKERHQGTYERKHRGVQRKRALFNKTKKSAARARRGGRAGGPAVTDERQSGLALRHGATATGGDEPGDRGARRLGRACGFPSERRSASSARKEIFEEQDRNEASRKALFFFLFFEREYGARARGGRPL